jgi:hypothetical protein
MNTTFRLSTVALAAALCWQTSAHATATEAQLRSVTLYGNVSIQEDSTSSWGPWAEFEPPAAGNTQPVAAPRGATDPYRPLAQTNNTTPTTPPVQPPVEGFCAGGSLCGFGAFQTVGDPNTETVEEVHPFRLNGTVVQGSGEGSNGLPQVIQLSSTPLSTGAFQLADSGNLNLYVGEGVGYSRVLLNNQERVQESYDLWPDGERVYSGEYDPEQVQAAHFNLATYVRGEKGVRPTLQQEGWGVIGYTTSTADMSALRASNAVATYSGIDSEYTPLTLTVRFGNGTWDGSWNGGADGSVTTQTTASGSTQLKGNVGFNVTNGTITGSTFSATAGNISATDGTILAGSVVQGAFFGPLVGTGATAGPAAAGGVVDIRKTVAAPPQVQQPTNVGRTALEGSRATYTNGRYVAPFLAVNNTIRRNPD